MNKIFSLLLALVTVFSMAAQCFAYEQVRSDGTIILGGPENDEGNLGGIVTYSDDSSVTPGSSIFTLHANAVYDMLTTTASGKYITKNMLSGKNISVSGTLRYTPQIGIHDASAFAGLCCYNSSKGIYESGPSLYFEFYDGVYRSGVITAKLIDGEYYYGFVKNRVNDGMFAVTGTLSYAKAS